MSRANTELKTSTEQSLPRIEFFKGIPEDLSGVSLRQDPKSGQKSVKMTFSDLHATKQLMTSYTRQSFNSLELSDSEGSISVTPSSCRLHLHDEEGEDLDRCEITFTIHQPDHWERFMRFMNRYAEANGMAYGQSQKPLEQA